MNFIDHVIELSRSQVLVSWQCEDCPAIPFAHGEVPLPVTEMLGRDLQMNGDRVMNLGFDSILLQVFQQIISALSADHVQVEYVLHTLATWRNQHRLTEVGERFI